MSDWVSVNLERLDRTAQRLEALRDGLAANISAITTMMSQYAQQGGDVAGLALTLARAQARSVTDAADMRARSQLAHELENAPVQLTGSHDQRSADGRGMLSIPWDMTTVDQQAALADAQELRLAVNSPDSSAARAEIQQVEQDIKDHLAEGSAGLPYLSAFYDQAGPQVARLASVLNSWDGKITQPLSVADQRTLSTFAAGLAYVTRNMALSQQAMNALTKAPDMWSVAMLIKYGPATSAFGAGPGGDGQKILQAVRTATVQISPHVIVPATDPAAPELRAAWAWAVTRHISLASTPGDVEYSRWVEIATISPYSSLFKGQLHQEFGSPTPDARIGGAFNLNEKVLISTSGLGAAVFFNDPRSLVGATPEEVMQLVPPDWTGPLPLKTGMPGWRFNGGKGRAIKYEEGDPNSPGLGQPDSLLHQGPYYKISENGYVYRIAAPGNPTLDDPNAITISITAQDGTKTYFNVRIPTDDPGDSDGSEGGLGDVGGDDIAVADG